MSKIYDGELRETWMGVLEKTDEANVRHLLCAFARLGIPKSYLDVGCGTGAMVTAARKLGVEAFGVDQLVGETWPKYFYHRNLVDKFILPKPVELVSCWEVGEHLHPSAHATLCDTLCDNLLPGGNYLLFSAARPGQGGTGHVACRPAEYWHEQFIMRGLTYNGHLTMNMALLFSNLNTPLNYFWDNGFVFEKT